MQLTPITLREANAFVSVHHRHHKPVQGGKFAIAVSVGETIHGVVIVGRPVSRYLDNGWNLEVSRCCTDGTKNACSMLYAAAWRATKALGYTGLGTYTLPSEGGASLRAAGWKPLSLTAGGNWNAACRPRIDTAEALQGQKVFWRA